MTPYVHTGTPTTMRPKSHTRSIESLQTALVDCADAWVDHAIKVMRMPAETLPTALLCLDEAVRCLALAQEWSSDGNANIINASLRLLEVRSQVEQWGRTER